MPIQHFTLIVEGADLQSQRVFDALFEAGCDDATIARVDGVQYVDFDREAANPGEAILSAMRDIKSVEGLRVTRVANVNPGSKVNLADRVQRTLNSVGLLVASAHGTIGSPTSDPRNPSRRWLWSELRRTSQLGLRSQPRKIPPSAQHSTQIWSNAAAIAESLRPAGTAFGYSAPYADSGSALQRLN